MANEKVLLYHFQGTEEAKKLKPVLLRMGIRVRAVEPEEFGKPLGMLAGVKDFKEPEALDRSESIAAGDSVTATYAEGGAGTAESVPADFPELMMVMCGFAGRRVDELLMQMRKGGVPRIDLKAMLTPTNMYWNSREVYEELKREHTEMQKMQESSRS